MNGLTLVVLSWCAALAAAGTYPAPAPVYGAPAPAFAPAPAISFASAPAVSFAPIPVVRSAPSVAFAPGVRPIPVVPFPGFGRAVVHHVADQIASKVADSVNHVTRTVALATQAVGNIARTIAEVKSTAFAPIVFSPATLAAVAPPAGLAPPVSEYGAPAAAPAPSSEYGVPLF